jgi:hypothetical protein
VDFRSLQVDFHGVEEAEEGVEEYVEEEDNDEDPQFVLADEWLEFFAKSEARRKESKDLLISFLRHEIFSEP